MRHLGTLGDPTEQTARALETFRCCYFWSRSSEFANLWRQSLPTRLFVPFKHLFCYRHLACTHMSSFRSNRYKSFIWRCYLFVCDALQCLGRSRRHNIGGWWLLSPLTYLFLPRFTVHILFKEIFPHPRELIIFWIYMYTSSYKRLVSKNSLRLIPVNE